jgi:hypothetical protein
MVLVVAAGSAGAHPGGLDRQGCHHDRKRGGYHCHGGGQAATARAPALAPVQRPAAATLAPRPPADGRAYRNCDEARVAGAAPVRRGEPGYGPHLDRDNDGVGCEPWPGR